MSIRQKHKVKQPSVDGEATASADGEATASSPEDLAKVFIQGATPNNRFSM